LKKLEMVLLGLGAALIAVSVHANDQGIPAGAPEIKTSVSQPAPQETRPAGVSRAIDGLSPGNRLIAQALFNAQKAATMSGRKPWSLERVAAARAAGRNWGDVFQQMKHEGFIEAETLGQVVTWYQYHQATASHLTPEPLALTGVTAATPPKTAP
jgi:hypothetical protein